MMAIIIDGEVMIRDKKLASPRFLSMLCTDAPKHQIVQL